jgi:peptidoglycan-N-acetylglucosamine deacetylase
LWGGTVWHNWRRAEKAGLFVLLILAALALLSLKGRYPVEPKPVYFVQSCRNKVALTFETLWSSENLEEILGVMEEEAVRATFFITGTWLKNHPEAAMKILTGGHEIGNYTMNHRTLLYLNQQELVQEISTFNELASEILEYRPRLFRPPLGLFNGLVLRKARQQGCQTVLFSVESYDWISNTTAEIIRRVEERAHRGAIIVFRVGAPMLPGALPDIIKLLRQQGLEPVSVSELLKSEDK